MEMQHIAFAAPNGSVSAVCIGGNIAGPADVADALGITSAEVSRFLHCGPDDTTVQNPADKTADLARLRWLCLKGYANAKKNA